MVEPHAEEAITRLSLATPVIALVNFKIFNLLDVMWEGQLSSENAWPPSSTYVALNMYVMSVYQDFTGTLTLRI